MRLLLDAHALIWSVDRPNALSSAARDALSNPSHVLFISAVTIWEISIKVGLGKLTLTQPFRPWIEQAVGDLEAAMLEITIAAADVQPRLPQHHGDPFDRMLVAHSQLESASIVSRESGLDAYGIQRIW
ncbi:MAG: type II toxin-antitoxin system VapC family toxin [Planctomycetaceae bacterium]